MPSDAQTAVAVVTGASAGIGRAIATALDAAGMRVVNADLVAPDGPGPAAHFERVDVTDPRSVADMVDAVLGCFGRLDVLVNNAGVAGVPGWEDQVHPRPEDWDLVFRVNVLGTVLCMRAARAAMAAAHGGRIVNVASISGRQGRPVFRHYAATKAAVIQLTRSLAPAFAADGVALNAVCPGLVWTPMWEHVGRAFARVEPAYAALSPDQVYARMTRERAPLGRGQTPQSIAGAVAFLASAEAAGLAGQVLNVDGGICLD